MVTTAFPSHFLPMRWHAGSRANDRDATQAHRGGDRWWQLGHQPQRPNKRLRNTYVDTHFRPSQVGPAAPGSPCNFPSTVKFIANTQAINLTGPQEASKVPTTCNHGIAPLSKEPSRKHLLSLSQALGSPSQLLLPSSGQLWSPRPHLQCQPMR